MCRLKLRQHLTEHLPRLDVLPCQVRVTLYCPAQAPLVVTSLKVSTAPLPQASVAVAVAKLGVAGQLMVDTAGRASITGAVTSCTLMVCVAVEALPQPSVAVQVRVTLY